jgi:DNA gyrase subunit B
VYDEPSLDSALDEMIADKKTRGLVIDETEDRYRQAGVTVSRFKGLGEMDADQLWETTMNPENRVLIKVNVEDAERADAVFTKLMGDDVVLRKNFIQSEAKNAKLEELDI